MGLLQKHTKQVSWRDGVPEMNKCFITGMPLFKSGKVRDIYDLGNHLLIVASDWTAPFQLESFHRDLRDA
jgi:hypothetical protein